MSAEPMCSPSRLGGHLFVGDADVCRCGAARLVPADPAPPVSETAAWTEQDERDLQNYATLDIGNLPIGVPEVVLDAAKLARYALRLREKIRGLNRRCQSAESGLAAKPTSGPNMGRAFANAAATMYRNQLDEAKAELARLRADNERLQEERGAYTAENEELHRIVEDLRAAATREGETPPSCEYESADGQQRCILSKHDEHLLAWKARPEASNAHPL